MSASVPQLVQQIASQNGVPPALALAVASQESGFNPNAVSSAGAQGVMQLMPATAAGLGVTNPFDPVQNITAGVRFLGGLLSQFGDVATALAAYNWGPGNVSAAIAKYGGDWLSHAPAETQNYVASITSAVGAPMPTSSPAGSDAGGLVLDSSLNLLVGPGGAAGIPSWALWAGAAVAGLVLLHLFSD